jgi:hypothetical protein
VYGSRPRLIGADVARLAVNPDVGSNKTARHCIRDVSAALESTSDFAGKYAAVLCSAMIQSRQIEAFRAVMLTGAMTNAAEMIQVSQPAVSRLVRDLEHQLGCC